MLSVMMPAAENIRGTSALPYHLMLRRDKSIEIELYTYNLNQLPDEKIKSVGRELNIKINVLQVPRWYTFLFKWHLLIFRLFLPYPIGNFFKLDEYTVKKINNGEPEGIWIYGEELSQVSRQFKNYCRLHTLPDCESLYYYRMLGNQIGLSSISLYWRYVLMYPKYVRMERNFDTSKNIRYHLVGKEDVKMLKTINPQIQADFIRHPHYEIFPKTVPHFERDKIRVLIAGQNNIYMANDAVRMIDSLIMGGGQQYLKENVDFTFLGKGWEKIIHKLAVCGYQVTHIAFAEDYIKEISKYDVQITPISIGTGTKGKVLDAFANGLLVVGSKYALENVDVVNGTSCIEYDSPEDIPQILHDISQNRPKYMKMAKIGQNVVLKMNDRETISKILFSYFFK